MSARKGRNMLVKILFRILKFLHPSEEWVIVNYHAFKKRGEGKGHYELYGHPQLRLYLREKIEDKK